MSTASRPTPSALSERSVLLDEHFDEPLPPPINRGRARLMILLAGGVVMLAVLVAVVLNLDRGLGNDERGEAPLETADARPPSLLTTDERPTLVNDMTRDAGMAKTGRAWIQATDEHGRLAQEYRYSRSEPAPGDRIEMIDPEVKVYLKDHRVLTMRGAKALVRVPSQALESGTMTGDVVIRLYQIAAGQTLDEAVHKPSLEVRTQQASYDNLQGDIHCPGDVDIQTATAWLPAIDLRLQINDVEGRPGELTIGRINGELHLAESVQRESSRPDSNEPARADAETTQSAPAAPAGIVASAEPVAERAGPAREDWRDADGGRSDRALQRQRERKAERRNERMPGSTAMPGVRDGDGPFFYRLTLNQNIRIRQGDGTRGWTATGDQLHIVFSLDNNDLDQSMSSRAVEPAMYGPAEPMSLSAAMVALAMASTQESTDASTTTFSRSGATTLSAGLFVPSETDTIITCDGPLTMLPLQNAAEQPTSPEDSRFELLGQPVTLLNSDDSTTILCEALRYASLSEVMELAGGARQALIIDSPDLYARSEDRFWVDRLNNTGAFEGPGWMVAGEDMTALNSGEAGPALAPERRGDVRIAWTDGVDLEFAPGQERRDDAVPSAEPRADDRAHDSFGRLRLATFDGNVAVDSPDFTLNAQIMAVGFPLRDESLEESTASGASSQPDAGVARQRPAGIEFMHAQQSVTAGSLSDGGSIGCDDLRVDFTSHAGKTVPLKMVAMGAVEATDPDRQTVWSDQLEVTFKPVGQQVMENTRDRASVGAAMASDVQAPATQAAEADRAARRRADVDTLTASGAVQILMADGARVFADRLEADGQGNKVILTGEDILVASDRTVISKGKRLELTAQGDRVLWPGPGEFAYYTTAVVAVDDRGRVARPNVDLAVNPRQMLATWQESMLYDALFDGGAGSIAIRGNVDAESTPSGLEISTLKGQEATLVFAKPVESAPSAEVTVRVPDTQPASAPASQPSQSMFAIDQRGRQLREIIAIGDAKMESHTWLNADHSDKPRVFYLEGQHIRYNDQTLEAVVTGAGVLLVRDERLEAAASQPSSASQPMVEYVPVTRRKADLPFGGKGTTMFRWTESLRMTRQGAESTLYDIVMAGGIEVRHRALDQSLSTMTGERLEATVDRSAGDAQQRDAGFDLGGSMDLRRIHALGNVYVDSPTRDVDCDEFDYDYATGIAKLAAADGRVVTVLTAGNPHPVQAKLFIWNTIEDTVQAQKVSGSSGR